MSQLFVRLRHSRSTIALALRPSPITNIYRPLATNSVKQQESKTGETQQGPKKDPKDSPNFSKINPKSIEAPFDWKSLTLGGSIIAALTGFFAYLRYEKNQKLEQQRMRSIGKAAIGGSFDLLDVDGKVRKSEEFLGKWLIVYFGFTNCPDVCPEELEKLAIAVDNLLKKGYELVPLFITVDPERDTPEMIKKYLSEFSDKFIGLTGSPEQVEKATRAYRVYYSAGPKDKDNDYIVDHTIISYLVNPKGELADYFGQTKTAEDIENSTMFQMKIFKK